MKTALGVLIYLVIVFSLAMAITNLVYGDAAVSIAWMALLLSFLAHCRLKNTVSDMINHIREDLEYECISDSRVAESILEGKDQKMCPTCGQPYTEHTIQQLADCRAQRN